MIWNKVRFVNKLLLSWAKACVRLSVVGAVLLLCWHPQPVEPTDWEKPRPFASDPLDFEATAYCDEGITKSGVPAGPGVIAADPRVLPMGSLVWVDSSIYRGAYQVMDTGRLIRGNIIDIYIPQRELALKFGRRQVKIIVLRYGFPG